VKLRNLYEVREAEIYYDELRWSGNPSLNELEEDELRILREDVSETIRVLEGWQNRRLKVKNLKLVKRVKAKLIDLLWELNELLYEQERVQAHWRRLENIWNPQPTENVFTAEHYGLQDSLKATPFYRWISDIFNPRVVRGAPYED